MQIALALMLSWYASHPFREDGRLMRAYLACPAAEPFARALKDGAPVGPFLD